MSSKCVGIERAKARAAVAMARRKLRVGLEKQMPADNNRPCQQTRMYEKEMIAFEKRHVNKQNKSRQWKTWLSRLMLEYCRFIIRRMTFMWCRSSFWDPGGYGQGYETGKYWQKKPANFRPPANILQKICFSIQRSPVLRIPRCCF